MGAVRSKVRLYDLAKDLRVDTKRLIQEVRSLGVDVSIPSNSIKKEIVDQIRLRHSAKKITTIEQSPKLTYKPFLGPLTTSASVGKSASRDDTEQITVAAEARKASAKRRSSIRRKESLRRRNKTGKTKIQLVYQSPKSSSPALQQQKVRICPICWGMSPSKVELRIHLVSTHMNEVIAGRVLCRLTADELCQATNRDLMQVAGIAVYMGCKIKKASDYIPADLVKDLVRRLRVAAPIVTRFDSRTPSTRQSTQIRSELLQASTKLEAKRFEELAQMDFGRLRKLIDDCLKGRRVAKDNQSLVTDDPAMLFDYARILESKIDESPRGTSILRRIIEDIEIYEKRGTRFGAKTKMESFAEKPAQVLLSSARDRNCCRKFLLLIIANHRQVPCRAAPMKAARYVSFAPDSIQR